jgi:hypothetical protein
MSPIALSGLLLAGPRIAASDNGRVETRVTGSQRAWIIRYPICGQGLDMRGVTPPRGQSGNRPGWSHARRN